MSEPSQKTEDAVKNLLGDAQSAHLTARKTQQVIDKGFQITGVVLASPTGERCIIEMSAARWLSNDAMQELMHPKPWCTVLADISQAAVNSARR